MFKLNRYLGLILIIAILLIVVPSSFAYENATAVSVDNVADSPISISDDNILTGTVDYYFDASCESDGNGSIDSPFKYLTADRIKSDSNIYLADGQYQLNAAKSVSQVNFIGNGQNTTIKYDGVAFTVSNYMTLTNLTIEGATITNNVNLTATNVVFTQGHGTKADSYGNTFGGAINCPSSSSHLYLENCTFTDNHAEYGGAIYMKGGSLEIINSIFKNNMAYNYGGSIACEEQAKVSISKSKFYNSYSSGDAGGAIYLKSSSLNASDVEIANSSATFGGAVASLDSNVNLSNLKISDCSAKWDGGAVYHLYGSFSTIYSTFLNNSANNGGALFIDNSTNLILESNTFISNKADFCAGAVYSLCNTLKSQYSIGQSNNFSDNVAFYINDEYELSTPDLNIAGGNYTMYKVNESVIVELPSKYDARELNLTTDVKDQMDGGNCWAFAALAVLESSILKASGQYLDLSEENMKNVIAKYSDYGWKIETNGGGNEDMLLGYLLSWLGPVLEADDAYDGTSILSPILDSVLHVQNVAYLKRDNYLDNDDIKAAIIRYGAVTSPILYESKYMKGVSYYCWADGQPNHMVVIVGWDDNYSASNFKNLGSDKGDGAWIVKNSWGPKWASNGYFYVSYYDEVFAQVEKGINVFAFILNDTIRYEKNYQYDIGGRTDYFYTGDAELWYKNVFYAEGDEFIAGVSTYFETITNWTASVYVNGNLQTVIDGISNPGYYTFDLDKFIPVHPGDEFEVEFKVSTSDVASVPISEYYSLNKQLYKPGVSFISSDGVNWDDFYNKTATYTSHWYASQVACIKAFTFKNIINTTLSLSVSDDFNITAKVTDQYGNLISNADVTFDINGMAYTLNLTDGVAVLTNPILNQTHNIVTAVFSQIGYNCSSNTISIDIEKTDIDLSVNISKYLNNAVIALESSNNINTSLIVDINNKNYQVIILNGKGYINLTDIENDMYTVDVECSELSAYQFNNISSSFVIDAKRTKIISGDFVTSEASFDLFNITLLDENGNILADKELVVVLNNVTLIKSTDSYGIASIPINLTQGDYIVEISFNGDDSYYKSNQSSAVKVQMDVDIDLTVERIVNNVAVNVSLSKAINESLTVIIGNKTYHINSTDGRALLEFSNLSNGVYNVTVSLDDSDSYNCMPVNSTFIIDVKNTEIISYNLVMNDAESTRFNITLTDENGIVMANKNVTFLLNGTAYTNVTDDAGITYIDLNLDAGDYDMSIIFEGDNDYFDCSASNAIKVKAKIDISVGVSLWQNNAVIAVNMSRPLNESINVTVNEKEYTVKSSDGKAVMELLNLSNDNYNVSVGLNGEIYDFTQANSAFTVNVRNTKILSNDTVTFEASGEIFNITLVDENNEILTEKELIIVLNNITINETTDSNGKVSIPINLTYGEYLIDISFKGDESYFPSQQSKKIKVKMNVDIDVNINLTRNNATVNVNMSKALNESLTVIVNNKTHKINSFNGISSLNLSNLQNGVYEVFVTLDDEDNYNCAGINSNFTVDVKNTKIISGDLVICDEDDADFNITLTDENGIALANKNVNFTLNNVTCNVLSDAQGRASISLALTMGTYDVVVAFEGDDDYFASKVSNIIKVKMNVTLDLTITKSSNNAFVSVNVSKPINESLTVNVNDKSYTVDSINGNALLNLYNLSNGKYTVIAGIDNENYNCQSVGYDFIMNVRDNDTAPVDVIVVDDNADLFNLTVTDENNNVLANKEVSIVIDDNKYELTADDNGQVSIPLSLDLGIHSIDIYLKENDSRFKSVKSDTIAIKTGVAMNYSIDNSSYKTIFNVNLSKDINGTLKIIVDNETYNLAINNKTMYFELANLNADLHTVKISIIEDDKYEFNELSTLLNINFKKTMLIAGDLITYYKSGQAFLATLMDEYGNLISGREVYFTLANRHYVSKTNEYGQASLNISLINGDYDIDVMFNGDNNYYSSSNSSKITVKTTIISNDNSNKTYGAYYSFKLLDVNGNPLKNTNVAYGIDNVYYAGATDGNGIVSLQITQQPGSHDLTILNPQTGENLSNKINVVERITQNKDISIYSYSAGIYKVLVLDDNGNPEVAGKVVTFKINGKTYSAKTDNSGYASLKISLGAKTYTITATYKDFKVSNKVKVKAVLTAKNVVKKKAKTYKFSAKLVNKNGKALKGKKLTFKIKGKKYTAKTNKKGVATITIRLSLKVGSYKIYTTYGKSKITNTLKIKR